MNFGKPRSPEPLEIVQDFNDCINRGDLDGLADLMTEDHTFIDSSGEVHAGKHSMVAGWEEFFLSYPDYRNHFRYWETRDDQVLIMGYSTCSSDALDGPALWTARVRESRVSEWRVYLDTAENRQALGLPADQGPEEDR